MSAALPRYEAQMVGADGRATREFYQWFRSVVSGIESQITDISNVVAGLVAISKSLGSPEGSTADIISVVSALADKADKSVQISGINSLTGGGDLSDDVALMLRGDRPEPGASMMYGTDADGIPGWQVQGIPSFVTSDNVAEGTTNLYFTDARAQDAVGGILENGPDVSLAYTPHASIEATLNPTGVAAGSYGDVAHIPTITLDAQGRATVAGQVACAFTFAQGTPSATWAIAHGLGKFPSVTVVDSAGSVVLGDVEFVDANNITLTFNGAFSGTAYLN